MLVLYYANEINAGISKSVIDDSNSLRKIPRDGDVFVLDHDFRDVKEKLEDGNLNALMPALKGKRKQLSAQEFDESRFVTKVPYAF